MYDADYHTFRLSWLRIPKKDVEPVVLTKHTALEQNLPTIANNDSIVIDTGGDGGRVRHNPRRHGCGEGQMDLVRYKNHMLGTSTRLSKLYPLTPSTATKQTQL